MCKILFITNENYSLDVQNVVFAKDDNADFTFELAILDMEVENSNVILLNLLNSGKEVICLTDEANINDLADKKIKIIQKPVNQKIIENEINIALETKKQLENLHLENMELKKNLYQIDAFYNASSKFAGTLDKNKLYEVLFETLERILSFDVACALFKDDFACDKSKFYIRSLKKLTNELNSNLIKRLSFAAKNEGLNLKTAQVETIQEVKPSYKNEFYNSDINTFDTLFAPIKIHDKFEGVIEIFRKTPFSKEDVTCFQSIAHQLLAPLRSAILYEEIINANEKLKKLEKVKSEFVSIVSHELRTPLTPINNALSIILSEEGGKIGEVNKNFANIAKRNISRLSGIIEDLLDLSRMHTGKFDFNFKKASIIPSLELAYSTFKNQAALKNIDFELAIDKNLPDGYIDQHRLDQILSNLITNALKFTPEGGKIKISAISEDISDKNILIAPLKREYKGKYLKISVSDTGVGIDNEDIPKIFDKFSQIENSLSRNTGGIGLGLTITKYFIDTHLGGIWVNSKKNEGSVFNVIIPVYTENTAFEADMNLKIISEGNVAYIQAVEPKNGSLWKHLKDENILKFTKTCKETIVDENDKKICRAFMTGIDKGAYDYMVSKIEEEIKDCDIVLSKAYYKKESN